jgi:hypothetical protein
MTRTKNNKTTILGTILKLVADDIASIFPYFLAFYIISLFVSIFFTQWRGYFYWPAFNLSVVFLALISLGSEKVRIFLKSIANGKGVTQKSGTMVRRGILSLKKSFWKKNLRKSDYLKLVAILLILIFSLFQGIYVFDFFVLFFGLVSVLFVLDMRLSAGCALVLLAACPFLLAFNENAFAETAAVYAYYFLVITVFTGIAENMNRKTSFLEAE